MKIILLSCMIVFCSIISKADRFYIMNATGYNACEPQLVAAIVANGHTVVVNSASLNSLPIGFAPKCVDPVNGYDWLCFFGEYTFSGLLPQIQTYIDQGGKVFYQYEVTCCNNSSSSAAAVLAGLTGLPIVPNSNPYIAIGSGAGWQAANIGCCATFTGNAYKGLDGMPINNQLQATSNLNGSAPLISACLNFGFVFATTDFSSSAHQGGIVGIGDLNFWYNGGEPFSSGGTTPVNTSLINFIFPNDTSTCFIFPPGCLLSYSGLNSSVISAHLGNDTTLCNGQTLALNAGNPGATYLWQDNSTNQTFQVAQPGTYWVKVTNSCGNSTDTIHVNYFTPSSVFIGNDTLICQGQSFNLNATISGATYHWQDNSTNPIFHVTAAGTYWVQVTAACGTASDTMHVGYVTMPSVFLGNDTSLCEGLSINLNASTLGASYQWQDNSTNSTFKATVTGTYWVNVTTNCGTVSDTIHITFLPAPLINLGNDAFPCKGQLLTLNATVSGASYHWQDNSSNSTFTVSQAGLYWVDVTYNTCTSRDSINVTYIDIPVVDLGPDRSLCPGSAITLNATTTNAIYLWQDQSIGATYYVSKNGNYSVDVTVNNCTGHDDVNIDFLKPDCECNVFIPNAFTPNNDTKNDELRLVNVQGIALKEFRIFNRWGEEVFNSANKEIGWNGNYKGAEAESGTYFYFVRYECANSGKEFFLKGDVILLR